MKKMVLLMIATILLVSNMTFAEWSTPILLDELNDPVTGETALSHCLSSDELTMYFSRYNTDGIVQIVEAYREDPVGPFTSERVISELYTNRSGVADPWISEDGLRLYYNRFFDYSTLILIRMATRDNISDPWTPIINFTDIHVNGYNDK